MKPERIKEIQQQTGYPDSISVQQALLQVWNECSKVPQQEISDEELENILHTSGHHNTQYHKDSIMSYGKICEHDDGYLCEHRRKYIIDLFKKT